MKEKYGMIDYNDKSYILAFTFNTMEEIQEEYGSIEEWGEMCGGTEPSAKAIKFGFAAMLNEGIDIQNEKNGTNEKPLTLKQVGRLITNVGLEIVVNALMATVAKSTEIDEKNA